MEKIRITADWEGRDDEYTNTPDDKVTVRYYADDEKDENYYYEMYVLVNDEKARVVVTPHGVSVDFMAGHTIHTNLVPIRMFPGVDKLEWDEHLNKILIILRRTGIEGRTYSKEEMDESYQRFLKETGYKEEDE